MNYLGESKKVTSVLQLVYFFFKCLEMPKVIIFRNSFYIFIILNTWIQDKLVFWCDLDCHFTFLPLYLKAKNPLHTKRISSLNKYLSSFSKKSDAKLYNTFKIYKIRYLISMQPK